MTLIEIILFSICGFFASFLIIFLAIFLAAEVFHFKYWYDWLYKSRR
jgi:ABC-type phosphate/phosphonate transport system permease subunit